MEAILGEKESESSEKVKEEQGFDSERMAE
jgi:hypothetical protein